MNEYQTWHAELLRETRIFMNGSLLTSLVKFMLCKTVAVIKQVKVNKGQRSFHSKIQIHATWGKGEQSDDVIFCCCFFVILCYF